MSEARRPDGADTFVISIPEGWGEMPIDPDELVKATRVRAAAAGENTASIEFRRSLVLLRRFAEQAQQGGVVFVASMNEAIPSIEPGEGAPADPYFVTALAWLVTHRASELGAGRIEFAQLQAAVEPEPTEKGISRVERPRVFELAAGPGIRDVSVQRVEVSGLDQPVDVIHCRYHLLVGTGEGMAVLGFMTPNVDLHEEMLGLFHAIAQTLEFVTA